MLQALTLAFFGLVITGLIRKKLRWWHIGLCFLCAAALLWVPPLLSDDYDYSIPESAIFAVLAAMDIALVFVVFKSPSPGKHRGWLGSFSLRVSRTGFLLLALMAMLVAGSFAGYPVALRQSFLTEDRGQSHSGEVHYTVINADKGSFDDLVSQTWWNGGLFIRRIIFHNGAMYAFTTSGRVFLFVPQENNDPAWYAESFWWTGNPHDFSFPNKYYGGG